MPRAAHTLWLIGLAMAALLAALIAGWLPCPWPVCRWIPLVPEPIATYADYRALLAGNRSAGGRVASRRPVDCEAVRQDVARRFRAGERLLAEPEEASPAQQWLVRNGLLDAWITGATLHLRNTLMETPESVETWRTRVERLLTRRPGCSGRSCCTGAAGRRSCPCATRRGVCRAARDGNTFHAPRRKRGHGGRRRGGARRPWKKRQGGPAA
jgi:hypothetical protein